MHWCSLKYINLPNERETGQEDDTINFLVQLTGAMVERGFCQKCSSAKMVEISGFVLQLRYFLHPL